MATTNSSTIVTIIPPSDDGELLLGAKAEMSDEQQQNFWREYL